MQYPSVISQLASSRSVVDNMRRGPSLTSPIESPSPSRSPSCASNLSSLAASAMGGLSPSSSMTTLSSSRATLSQTSAVRTINSVIIRQPSIVNLEAERNSFASELDLLEPRPIVYWSGVEERMGSLDRQS